MTLTELKMLVENYTGVPDIGIKRKRLKVTLARYIFAELAVNRYNYSIPDTAETINITRSNIYNCLKQHAYLTETKDTLYMIHYNRVIEAINRPIFKEFLDRIPHTIIEYLLSLNDSQLTIIESYISSFEKNINKPTSTDDGTE